MQYLLTGRVWPAAKGFFFFYKSENAKEILFKVELQSMKSKLVAVWTGHLCRSSDLMSDIRRSQHT